MTSQRRVCLTLGIVLAIAAGPAVAQVAIVDRPDTAAKYDHYAANRPPLSPSPVVRLPLGAVRPAGWLKRQLELQADGFHGHLTEISGFLNKENNAWLSKTGEGERGWEEVPYWVKGFIGCAYLLDNERMIQEANIWIEGALNSQQEDGWFGPDKGRTGAATDLKGREDLWPNMIMLFCLQTYYERTSDPRVLKLMEKYFRYLSTVPEEKFLVGYWPAMRGGDQLYSILWLYNITGQPWLLDLAHKTHRRTARWDTVTDTPGREIVNWHNVNIAQAFREPAVYWMLSQNADHLAATEQVWSKIRELYGQVPGGMYGADENTRPGYNGPRQAIETCGIAEEMLSDGLLISATGDPIWAERCENAAFNTYPASMTADLKALRYLTAPNQPQSDHTNKAPGVQNGGPMFHMNPHDHRCCQHNSGHSWPYFTQHLWYAAPGNGLAAYLYAPCEVQAQVADGVTAKIVEETRYPFEEQITFKVSLPKTAAFPLYLRIPAWCDQAQLTLNGEPLAATLPAGKLAKIERTWKDGDQLVLALPMQVKLTTWTNNRGTVSVNRGPLTYSLQIKEEYKRHGGTDEWPAWDIFPGSPWNYGLVLSDAGPATFQVVQADWPADNQPFCNEAVPVRLTAKAKRIPNWILDPRLRQRSHPAAGQVDGARGDGDPDPDGRRSAADLGVSRDRQRPGGAGVAGAAAAQAVAVQGQRLALLRQRHGRRRRRRPGTAELQRPRDSASDLVAAARHGRVGAIRLWQGEGGFRGFGVLVRRHGRRPMPRAASLETAVPRRPGMETGRRGVGIRRLEGPLQSRHVHPGDHRRVTHRGATPAGVLRRRLGVESRTEFRRSPESHAVAKSAETKLAGRI